jgi:hypothetical protein
MKRIGLSGNELDALVRGRGAREDDQAAALLRKLAR